MKKLLLITMLIVFSSSIYAQELQDEFLGAWMAEPFLIEQDGDLLVEPKAAYSFPHIGITRVDFLDSEFIVFTVSENKYRAFYEIEELDFDNFNISCIFKNGEQFMLKLVRSEGESWKYLYRITENSVLRGNSDVIEELDSEQVEATEMLMPDDMINEESETAVVSLFTGFIKRK